MQSLLYLNDIKFRLTLAQHQQNHQNSNPMPNYHLQMLVISQGGVLRVFFFESIKTQENFKNDDDTSFDTCLVGWTDAYGNVTKIGFTQSRDDSETGFE